jgi:2-hydroxy-3-keto-5-methylthiopentenyl-1-phosphate phosphatase
LSGRTIAVDFDGTVTEMDLLDTIARDFGDPKVYAEVDRGLDEGNLPLRDVITREFEPVTTPLDEVVQWELDHVRVRDGFRDFVDFARGQGWRVVIVSSGFHELIEPILEREGVEVELHANRVDPSSEGWRVEWRYDETCDSCRCAAEASSLVFATRGLADYLDERGVPYEPFDDFHDVVRGLTS